MKALAFIGAPKLALQPGGSFKSGSPLGVGAARAPSEALEELGSGGTTGVEGAAGMATSGASWAVAVAALGNEQVVGAALGKQHPPPHRFLCKPPISEVLRS